MALVVDCFWSFRSPYSSLATGRMVRVAAEYDVDLRIRPVLPLAIRTPDFFERVNPLWPPYLMRLPTFAFQGEPFFGQDRIDLLLWRLHQHGLTHRVMR